MNIQEIEERDFNPQTEMQMCYEEASMLNAASQGDYVHQAKEAAKEGKVAAVVSYPVYCKSTDALVGTRPCKVVIGETEEEVRALLGDEYDEEASTAWYGLAPVTVPAPIEDDGVPF